MQMSLRALLSSHTQFPQIPHLLDQVWNMTTERALSLLRHNAWLDPVCGLAEAAVVRILSNIHHGHLDIVTDSRTYSFPPDSNETMDERGEYAEIRVLKSTFWIRLALMSDLGFAEAYMFGEADCSDLPTLFRLFLKNRSAMASMNSPFSSLFHRVPQFLAKSHFINSLGNSQRNISAHYDISNDMFMGFLSRDMTYSCAIFTDLDADLDPRKVAEDFMTVASRKASENNAAQISEPAGTTTCASPSLHGLAVTSVLPSSPSSTSSPLLLPVTISGSSTVDGLSGTSDALFIVTGDSSPTCVPSPPSSVDDGNEQRGRRITYPCDGNDKEIFKDHAQLKSYREDELYNAQMRKLDHIIKKADIRPGHRVLEIGSGWGSLALRIVQTIPETVVDTITLSVQQYNFLQEHVQANGNEDKVRVHLLDYRAMPRDWEHAFDRVVSVEMLEAVGKGFIEVYWTQVDWALKKDTGAGVIQCITIPEDRYETYSRGLDFIQKWVLFPGGHLPTLTHLVASLAAGSNGTLVVDSISNIGPHYARTLREWKRRFEWAFEDTIIPALKKEHPDAMDGPRGSEEIEVFRRKWLFYFCYCEVGFATRALGDHIISFARVGHADYACQVLN